MESQILNRISQTEFLLRKFRNARQRFANDENGAVLVFALVLFVLMVMMGGLAVDLMRAETTRTTIANTLDRSTLAASGLSQKLLPKSVVEDYFAKAGMTSYLKTVTVSEGLNFRNVNAVALADAKPFFMHMLGINKLEAGGASTAEQRINNVEIALVLDVSGSMQGTKITNMKAAAAEFVATVLLSDADDRISIGLVPYNGQVNLGATMAAKYNLTARSGKPDSQCVDLPPSVYTTTDMSRTLALPETAYADTLSSTTRTTSYLATTSGQMNPGFAWCPAGQNNIVRPPINNVSTLQGYINGLNAVGATSINAGLKWGLALLDPASRPMFAELATANQISSIFLVRPSEYTDLGAMKVIVLMIDGEHWPEERMNTAYKDGLSPIYKGSDGYYSIRHTANRPSQAGTNEYFVPHLCVSNNCKSGADTTEAWKSVKWSSGAQQTWQQVWATFRVSYVAWQMYERALGKDSNRSSTYNTWMANFKTTTADTTMDTQLQAICTLAKSKKNVTVYGIAFEAPTRGQQMISQCSSGASYFFVSSATNIKTAFRAIATNITQLRLTQ